jgi:hypothetical protein
MDTLPQLKDITTKVDIGNDQDLPPDGTSVDGMIVDLRSVDPGIGDIGVGSLGLAASADSGGTADVSGAKPPPPRGSSGGIVLGTGGAGSIGVGGNAASATLVNQPATTDASGSGPIEATADASGTLGPVSWDIALAGDPGSGPGPGATHDVVTFAGSGLTFNNTFEASVTLAYKANILTAEQDLAALFTDNITINEDFLGAANGQNGDLASNSFSIVSVSYTQLKGALQGKSTDSAIALAAYNSLPATDPAGAPAYFLPGAYANFMGLNTGTFTDTVTLNTSYNWSFGQDVVDTMMHEISEGGMGRVGGLVVGLGGRFSTMDLFSYNAAGQHDRQLESLFV